MLDYNGLDYLSSSKYGSKQNGSTSNVRINVENSIPSSGLNLDSLPSISSSLSISNNFDLDNLPDFNYSHLFKHLDLDEIWSIRLVSKNFYSIVKSYDIIRLSFAHNITDTFIGYDNAYKCNRFSNEFIGLRSLPLSKMILLLPNKPSNNLLNLRYLRIWNQSKDLYWNFEILNKFTKLQILDLHGLKTDYDFDILSLQDLKSLSIQLKEAKNLVINAPKLTNLHIDIVTLKMMDNLVDRGDLWLMKDKIEFRNPRSVRHLQIDHFDQNVLIFKNLECLEFEFAFNLEMADLLKLTKLRKLKFNHAYYSARDMSLLKALFRSKKDGLEMVLDGVRIRTINKFNEYDGDERLKFQLDNYRDLEYDLHFVVYIDYNDLMRLVPYNQPVNLLDKFNNIQWIHINGVVDDENRLITFIRNCPNLIRLEINNSPLRQSFYNRLPSISSLSYLAADDNGINYKFIKKMTYLVELRADKNALLVEGFSLNDLKYFKTFAFKIDNEQIVIIKDGKDNYRVDNRRCLNLPNRKYYCLYVLIKCINNLKDKEPISKRMRIS